MRGTRRLRGPWVASIAGTTALHRDSAARRTGFHERRACLPPPRTRCQKEATIQGRIPPSADLNLGYSCRCPTSANPRPQTTARMTQVACPKADSQYPGRAHRVGSGEVPPKSSSHAVGPSESSAGVNTTSHILGIGKLVEDLQSLTVRPRQVSSGIARSDSYFQ